MSSFFNAWLFYSGVFINLCLLVFIVYLIWIALVWPFVEACSLARCTVKALGNHRKTSIYKIWWWAFRDLIGGRDFYSVRTDRFRWSGVGDWVIFYQEEEPEDGSL